MTNSLTALENEKTTFCEIYNQRVATESHYKDLMGFPVTVFKSHPLKFSVAHRHHERQMRSGWALKPKSSNDRHDDLNNTIIETWSVNSIKHAALDESYYPQLQQIVEDYKIPNPFYDPDRAAEIVQPHGSVLESYDETGDGMEPRERMGENLGEELGEELESFVEDEFTYADTHQEIFEGEKYREG